MLSDLLIPSALSQACLDKSLGYTLTNNYETNKGVFKVTTMHDIYNILYLTHKKLNNFTLIVLSMATSKSYESSSALTLPLHNLGMYHLNTGKESIFHPDQPDIHTGPAQRLHQVPG